MVKNGKSKKSGASKGSRSTKVRSAGVSKRSARAGRLDAYAAQYARLLADPCGAAVVHPVYSGAEAGFLFRAESVLTLGTGATDTSGILHWVPGYANSNNSELGVAAAAGPSALVTIAANGNSPGKPFLGTNAFGARCVAACIKVIYPGNEQGRSGRVHYGHTQASFADIGDANFSIDNYALGLQHYTRTPPEAIEVIWRPGHADQEFNDPAAGSTATLRDRKSALTVAWAGLPVATGLTFYLTAVYEWTPRPSIGVSANATGKNPSQNTLDEVIDAVQATGFSWVKSGIHTAGMGVGTGLVAGMASLYGRMSARSYRTRLGFY